MSIVYSKIPKITIYHYLKLIKISSLIVAKTRIEII